MGDKTRGLYRKYFVQRLDPTTAEPNERLVLMSQCVDSFGFARTRISLPPPKHTDCLYFILDLDHDPLAAPAIRAYATVARAAGYGLLADDLDRWLATRPVPPAGEEKT